jgi:hypothetical protein
MTRQGPVAGSKIAHRVLWLAVVVGASVLGACNPVQRDDSPPIFDTGTSVTYDQAVAEYNANTRSLGHFWANAVVRMAFVDDEGKRREEQGEGRLQIIQPDRVALNIGKLGQTYVWLGCDADRYWWLDMTGDKHIGFTGRHEGYQRSRSQRFGVVVPPLDLITVLGIAPLPTRGAIQTSSDGRLLGLTSLLRDGRGRQRVWIDRRNALPVQIELFDAQGTVQLVADLSDHQTVSVRGVGNSPRVASRVRIAHQASGSMFILDLSEMEDGKDRIRLEAFNLGTLLRQMRVEELYDLDTPRPESVPARR